MQENDRATSSQVRAVARVMDVAKLLEDVTYTRQAVTRIEDTIGRESNGHGTGILGRLRKLEDASTFRRGAMWAFHLLWSMLMFAGGWVVAHWHEIVKVFGL